jgi:TolA-binding protein
MSRISRLPRSPLLVCADAGGRQVPRGFRRRAPTSKGWRTQAQLQGYQDGVDALQAKNFQVAEGIFDEILRQNPNHADANFMMGVTKMSLEKWDDARKFLEVAVRKSPKEPDPRSRLGVTLIKLGDIPAAWSSGLRSKMNTDCKGKCNAQ